MGNALFAPVLAAMLTGSLIVSQGGPIRPRPGGAVIAKALVGAWRLISFESRTTGGDTRQPLGRAPRGQLLYEANGRMSAQLMNPERPPFASGDLSGGTDAEVRAAVGGYIAYYGTYTVDAGRRLVTHHVEGALFPNWIGSDQVREFRLNGDRLTLQTPPIRMRGEESVTVLVWERVR